MQYMIPIFVAGWHHKVSEFALKNCENSNSRLKSLRAPLHSSGIWKIPLQ